jgi:hypothetical protein
MAKSKKRVRPEKDIQRSIMAWLKRGRYVHWRQQAGKYFATKSGLPDIVVVLAPYGHVLGLEVKSAVGKQRPAQKKFQAQLEKAGGTYQIVRTLDEAKRAVVSTNMMVAYSTPSQYRVPDPETGIWKTAVTC